MQNWKLFISTKLYTLPILPIWSISINKTHVTINNRFTRGSWCASLPGGRKIPRGSIAKSGCIGSTFPIARSACGALQQDSKLPSNKQNRIYRQTWPPHKVLETNKSNKLYFSAKTDLPGTELKSPQTSIGISALAAIFSNPFNRVWTWYEKKK